MSSTRFRDFDAAWEERRQTRPPMKAVVMGKMHTFPGRMPAKLVLQLSRLQRERPGQPIDLEETLDLLSPLVGKETLEGWIEAGIDVDELAEVLRWATETYSIASEDRPQADGQEAEGEEGDPPVEKVLSTSASNSGRPSKPTGGESTGAT